MGINTLAQLVEGTILSLQLSPSFQSVLTVPVQTLCIPTYSVLAIGLITHALVAITEMVPPALFVETVIVFEFGLEEEMLQPDGNVHT